MIIFTYNQLSRQYSGFLSYLKVKDDGPNETQGELWVAVHNVLSTNVDEFDFFISEEAKSGLHVLDGVESHSTSLAGLKIYQVDKRDFSTEFQPHTKIEHIYF